MMNVVVMAIFDAGTVVEVVRLNVITVMVQEVFAVIGAMELGKMGVVFIVLVWDMMMMALCVFFCDGTGKDDCLSCYGRGYKDCDECEGSGQIECDECNGYGKLRCGECEGEGKVKTECPDCEGSGRKFF